MPASATGGGRTRRNQTSSLPADLPAVWGLGSVVLLGGQSLRTWGWEVWGGGGETPGRTAVLKAGVGVGGGNRGLGGAFRGREEASPGEGTLGPLGRAWSWGAVGQCR